MEHFEEKEMEKESQYSGSAPIFSKVKSIFKKYFINNFSITATEANYQKYPYQQIEQNSVTLANQTINSIVADNKQLIHRDGMTGNDNSFGTVCFFKKEDEICNSIYGGRFDDMDP